MGESTPKVSNKRSRSPGYPNFGLEEAIRRASVLYEQEKRNATPLSVAAEHWGYTPTSSAVLLSVATLKKYGLLDEAGGGSSRLVKLSDLALNIILSQRGSNEWDTAVQTAALLPKIHADLWNQYGVEIPSDNNLKRTLIMEKGFNDDAASDVVRVYKETISFAEVQKGDRIGDITLQDAPNEGRTRMGITSQSSAATSTAESRHNSIGMQEYSFPLIGVRPVTILMPDGLTEENFELLKAQLDSFFKVAKRALIAGSSKQSPAESEADD